MIERKKPQMITLLLIVVSMLTASAVAADWAAGVEAFRAGEFEAAARQFELLVDRSPEEPQSRYMLAECLQRLGRSSEALGHLERATALSPGDARIATSYGKLLLGLERYQEASTALAEVELESLPEAHRLLIHRIRGESLFRSKQFALAVDDLEVLAKANPKDAEMQLMLGMAALKSNQATLGLSALEAAANLAPSNRSKQLTYARALIDSAAEGGAGEQNLAKAITVLTHAETLSPSYETTLLRASTELMAGLDQEAVDSATRASNHRQADWRAYFALGQASGRLADWDAAEVAFSEALAMTTSAADRTKVSGQLAVAYENSKQWELAIELYQRIGDSEGVERATHNRDVKVYNLEVDEHNAERDRIARELEELGREIDGLEGEARR